jgi:hypothetical protein
MTNHWACNNSNKTDATCQAGAFYLPQHLSSPQILVWFVLSDFYFFGVVFYTSLFVLFRFTVSDYNFGIFFLFFFYTFSYKSCDNACSNVENKSKMLRSEMRAAILDFGTASKGIFLVILVTWHEVVHEHFYDMSKISQSMFTYLAFKSFCSVLSIFGEGNSRNELCTLNFICTFLYLKCLIQLEDRVIILDSFHNKK